MASADLLRIRREALQSERDITGATKSRGDLFSKRIGNMLSLEVKAGVRSIEEDSQAEGYRDAVRELELVHCRVADGAFRKTFGEDPKPLKKRR